MKYVDHTYFDDYSYFGFYNSIRQGRVSGDPKDVDSVQLKYENDIQYKLNHCTDDTWRMLHYRIDSTINLAQIPVLLYNLSLPIIKSKWDDLQNLKYSYRVSSFL